MNLEQVKEFMRKKLPRELVQSKMQSNERSVVYKSNHVIDLPKKKENSDTCTVDDESGMHLTNDTKSHPFVLINEYLSRHKKKSSSTSPQDNDEDEYSNTVVSLIAKPHARKPKSDEYLEIIRRGHGNDLYEFMMDKKSGKLNKKYDKVFIC